MLNSDILIFWSLFLLGKEPDRFPNCLQSPKGSEPLVSLLSPSKPGFFITNFCLHVALIKLIMENGEPFRRTSKSETA